MIAKQLDQHDFVRGIADGPYGGTLLRIGNEVAGEMITASRTQNTVNWSGVRVNDYSLAQTAHQLAESKPESTDGHGLRE